MKNKILELFKAYERETEFDGNAINEEMYDSLANNLVNLLTGNTVKLVKDCLNCKHKDVDRYKYPCSSCNTKGHLWQSE